VMATRAREVIGAEVADARITWRKGCNNEGGLVGGQIISMKIGASITFTANEFSPKPAKSSHQRIVLHALSFLSP
jgi:hypothetical protein